MKAKEEKQQTSGNTKNRRGSNAHRFDLKPLVAVTVVTRALADKCDVTCRQATKPGVASFSIDLAYQ